MIYLNNYFYHACFMFLFFMVLLSIGDGIRSKLLNIGIGLMIFTKLHFILTILIYWGDYLISNSLLIQTKSYY